MSNKDLQSKDLQSDDSLSASEALLQIIHGFRKSQLVHVAARVGIADFLKNDSKSNEEIAASIGMNAQRSLRFMRGLVWCALAVQEDDGRFQLTEIGKCLRTDIPDSMHEVAIGIREQYPAWGALLHTVQTGETGFNHVFGMGVFDYHTQNPEVGEIFNRSMVRFTKRVTEATVRSYDFSSITKIVDVGGGYGTLIAEILKANPHMTGILFDRASVVEGAKKYLGDEGVTERCEIVSGNFFDSIPEGGDGYILKSILHDWDDDSCVRILKNCHNPMRVEGKLLIVENEMPERVDQSTRLVNADLNMMVLPGGRERSKAEFESLFATSGFHLNRVVTIDRELRVFEGVPA